MIKRIRIIQGDVFRANLEKGRFKYLQFVMLDPAQLNSQVIRVFNYEEYSNENTDLLKVAKSEIEFYAHVFLKWGVQMGLWEKVGNVPIESDLVQPIFRTVPLDKHIEKGQITFCKTDDWLAWQAGQSFDDRKPIGNLSEETEKYFLGSIMAPHDIIERMKSGSYNQPYFT
jgi:hypothetical protein